MEKVTETKIRLLVTKLAQMTGEPWRLEARSGIYGRTRYRVVHERTYRFYPSDWQGERYMTSQEAYTALSWALVIEREWREKRSKDGEGKKDGGAASTGS